jgi:hypothetical protein
MRGGHCDGTIYYFSVALSKDMSLLNSFGPTLGVDPNSKLQEWLHHEGLGDRQYKAFGGAPLGSASPALPGAGTELGGDGLGCSALCARTCSRSRSEPRHRAGRVAEMDKHPRVCAELGVASHLGSMVRGKGRAR